MFGLSRSAINKVHTFIDHSLLVAANPYSFALSVLVFLVAVSVSSTLSMSVLVRLLELDQCSFFVRIVDVLLLASRFLLTG